MKIRHFKNIKPAIPPVWFFTKKPLTIYFVAKESTKYVQPDPKEQKDWLKSLGLSYSPIWNSHKNSVMLGWRYNPTHDLFEFSHYIHRHDGVYENVDDYDDISPITAKVGEPVMCQIIPEKDHLRWKLTNLKTGESMTLLFPITLSISISKWARTISPWFGGTLPPPKKVTYDLYWNVSEEYIKKVYGIHHSLDTDNLKSINE